MATCELYDEKATEFSGKVAHCQNKAKMVVHLEGGGKDWYLCERHFRQLRRTGALSGLIKKGRVKVL